MNKGRIDLKITLFFRFALRIYSLLLEMCRKYTKYSKISLITCLCVVKLVNCIEGKNWLNPRNLHVLENPMIQQCSDCEFLVLFHDEDIV